LFSVQVEFQGSILLSAISPDASEDVLDSLENLIPPVTEDLACPMGMIGATCTVGVISVQPNGNGRLRRLQSTGDLRIEFTVFICGTVECNGEGADQSVAPPPFLRRNLQLEACVTNLASECNDVDYESNVDVLFDGFSERVETAIQDGSLISDLKEVSTDLSDLLDQTTAMVDLTPPPPCNVDAECEAGVCFEAIEEEHCPYGAYLTFEYLFEKLHIRHGCDEHVPLGEICEADGECGSNNHLNNCGILKYHGYTTILDIYRRVECCSNPT